MERTCNQQNLMKSLGRVATYKNNMKLRQTVTSQTLYAYARASLWLRLSNFIGSCMGHKFI
jgi:hypothetical protein